MNSGILIVISGFSGAGKGTLVNRLVTEYDNYALSISMTTRKPRVGEVNGKSYFFVTHEEFEHEIKQDGLLEYASYCDNYYGTPKFYVEEQLKSGKDVILEIEVQGALQIKEKYPDALLLFVTPPSAKVLKERLESRGTETKDVIDKRMRTACKEAEVMKRYDFIVVNDDLDNCVKDTHEMIRAAHYASNRSDDFIQFLKEDLLKLS